MKGIMEVDREGFMQQVESELNLEDVVDKVDQNSGRGVHQIDNNY